MTQHYGFLAHECNSMFDSRQGVYLLSSTSSTKEKSIKGLGSYLHLENFRRCMTLYAVRTLPKHSWVNDPNVYIGEPKI